MEVFERPADTYVASFIGAPAMNFLPGELTGGGTAVRLHAGPVIPFTAGTPAGPDGHAVTIGIRPEHVTIQHPVADSFPHPAGTVDAQSLMLRVELVEPLGSETLIHGRLDTGGIQSGATAQEIVVRTPGQAPSGETLLLHLMPEHLHRFDAASGRRMPDA
jgi:sn-glycerol 3-phosphate transport system ATP-binding protein